MTLREFLLPRDRSTAYGACRAMILPFAFAALLNWLGWLRF